MTSSTASNSILASLARSTPSHRSILSSRSIARPRSMSSSGQTRRVRPIHRRRLSASPVAPVPTVPVVDLNNNSSIAMPIVTSAADNSIALDRVAILKAFAASQASGNLSMPSDTIPSITGGQSSRFEKPTSYREARRRQLRPASLSDPAIEQEFIRLRDTVPSIAGSSVSDLTIINEAISLICDLETQLLRKLKCAKLPSVLQTSSN